MVIKKGRKVRTYKKVRVNLVTDEGEIIGNVEVEVLQKNLKFHWKGKVDVYAQIARRPEGWECPDEEDDDEET